MAGVNVNTNVLECLREDDFVEYFLFPPINTSDEKEQETIITSTLDEVNKIVQKYTKDFLWHKDEFKLIPKTSFFNFLNQTNQKKDLPPHLYGIAHYGYNIEDEWFMVFILHQLTKEIPGLIARVCDADGEFLLIEAADYLPSWSNPETCENRVYLYEGNLHLIPPKSSEEDYEIDVTEAISKIRENPFETLACSNIQTSIKNKFIDFPYKIKHNLHRTAIYVPVAIAAILKQRPNLISPAVQAFCNRDSVDLKACQAMKYFPPENRLMTSVTFTKCLYAMLTQNNYLPDRRTGWNLPVVKSPLYKAHILGVKVACGFEILASQAKPSADIDSDRGWISYLKSLKDKSYFKGLMEHSKDYNNLLNRAKEYYIINRDTMLYPPAVGQEILDLINIGYNVDELKKLEQTLPKDDDDSWLNISPEELEKMLEERYGQKKIFNVNNNTDAATFTGEVTNFLNHISDVKGVEFPSDTLSSPKCKNKNRVSFSQDTKIDRKPENNKINFDPNSFTYAVQNILNFVIPEDDSWNLESESDMSEYEEDNYVKDDSYNEAKGNMQKYMEEMDKELSATTIGDSFEKKSKDGFDDIETFQPVNIDVNTLKNILESYKAQLGEPGPSSNMLGPMGIHLDSKDKDTN